MKPNKPIPAIIRFHKRFLSEWVFEESQPLWRKEAPNPKEVIDFLNAELLNERERILKEQKEKVIALKQYLHQLQTSIQAHPTDEPDELNLIESIKEKVEEEFFELKEGGE